MVNVFDKMVSRISGGRMLIASAALLILLIWSGIIWQLNNMEKQEISDSTKRGAEYARSFGEYTLRTVQSADQVATFLRYQCEYSLATTGKVNVEMTPYRGDGMLGISPYVLITLVDENGNVITTNQEVVVFANVSDREHFRVHKDVDIKRAFVSKPVLGRSSGKWSMQLTRRINKPNGDFGGIVVVSLDPFYLTGFYKQTNMGPQSVAALIGMDGIIRGWQSGARTETNIDFNNEAIISAMSSNDVIVKRVVSVVDGVDRILFVRALKEYPLLVCIGLSPEDILADYRNKQQDYIFNGAVVTIAILALSIFLISWLEIQQDSRRRRTMLQEILEDTDGTETLNEAGRAIVNIIKKYVTLDNCVLYVKSDVVKTVSLNNVDVADAVWQEHLLKWQQSVIDTQKTQVYRKELPVMKSDSAMGADSEMRWQDAQWVGVPLRLSKDAVFGVLSVYSRDAKDMKVDDSIEVLKGISSQVATIVKRKLEWEDRNLILQLVEQTPLMIVLTDADGTIKYVNSAVVEGTGYAREELLGGNPRLLNSSTHPESFFTEMWDTLKVGGVWSSEICNRKKNGELYWERAVLSSVKDKDGHITHFMAHKEDNTERRKLNDALEHAKEAADAANQAKSLFLANMSHEIRTPMNAVLGFAQLLQREALTPQQRKYVDTIDSAGRHLLELINSVLDMVKIETGKMTLNNEVFEFGEAVRDVEQMFRLSLEERGIKFDVVKPDVPVPVVGDRGKIRQVMVNLVGNAAKFTKEGKVVLKISANESSDDTFCIKVSVADTGAGMSETEVADLFRPFKQTQSGLSRGGGTGLGLAISQDYIRKMGGEISVTSEQYKGSTFSFAIDLPKAEVKLVEAIIVQNIIGIKDMVRPYNVLVVDDERNNRELLVGILERLKFICAQAVDGQEAINIAETMTFDLIIMDVKMPVMDGFAATKVLRKMGVTSPILILTASAFGDQKEYLLMVGANDYMTKPFRTDELMTKMQNLLNIEYIYATTDDEEQVPVQDETPQQESVRVELSSELVERLQAAVIDGDYFLLEELLKEVEAIDAPFADKLRELAEKFDYERLQTILAEGETK